MGIPTGGAVGSITINTAQLAAARAAVAAFATGVNTTLTGMNLAINKAQNAVGGLSASIGQLGVSFGVLQLGRFVIEADALATSYRRQSVAARGLAGSQGRLNELLEVYDKATGGILDKATALQSVTKLMAVGFADSSEELEKFATAIRGISVGMGMSQDTVTQNLILELFTQRGMRLDQLGLQYDKVRARADALAAADSSLTDQMAYQQAVLEQAIERYGDLATSAEGAATGAENAAKAFKDVKLAWGELTGGPVGFVGNALSEWLQQATEDAEHLRLAIVDIGQAFGVLPRSWPSSWNRRGDKSVSEDVAAFAERDRAFANRPGSQIDHVAANAVKLDWSLGVKDINDQLHDDIIDAETTYGQQRADTIRSYARGVAREAQDFALQRQRQEQELAQSIVEIHAERVRQEQRAAQELARTIGQARSDSAERIADMQEDFDRTIGERRADSAERVAEMEEDRAQSIDEKRIEAAKRVAEIEDDFQKQRVRALQDYEDNRENAASRLDARAVAEMDKAFQRESVQADEAHEEQLTEEQKRLEEAITQLNQAHAERLADEKKSLDKSIQQQQDGHNRQVADEKEALGKRITQANEAYALQLADARAADALRIGDMKTDFAARTLVEDADRTTRLGRMATDHDEQLGEMGRAHGLRLTQINTQAAEERKALNDKFVEDLVALGVHVDGYIEEIDRITDAAIADAVRFLKGVTEAQELTSERSQIQQRLGTLIPGTSEWTELRYRLNEIDVRLKQLTEGAGVASAGVARANTSGFASGGAAAGFASSASSWAAMAGNRYVMPQPVAASAATGTGGNSITIGQMNPTLVFGDVGDHSKADIKQLVGEALLEWEQKVAKYT